MVRVLMPLAPGFEELEAITVIDLLRRAGMQVVTAGIGTPVVGSHDIPVVPDQQLDDALDQDWDLCVLPGGQPGSDNMEAHTGLRSLLRRLADSERFTAAICAAPKVLASAGLLDGKQVTAFPGVLDGYTVSGMRQTGAAVEQDGKVITSRGPGTAMDFALVLIERLLGEAARAEVEGRLQRP